MYQPKLNTKGGAALGKSRGYQIFVNFLFLSLGALANTGNDKDYEDEANDAENATRVFGFGGWPAGWDETRSGRLMEGR